MSSPIDDLKVGAPADGGDFLRAIPGVSGSRMGGHGIDPIIRGQSHNRLNNLLDNTYAYHVNRANIDPFNPDPVQVNEPGREFWVRASLKF